MNWVKKAKTLVAIVVISGVCIQQTTIADIGFHIGGDNDNDNSGLGFHVGTNACQMGKEDERNGAPRHEWVRGYKQRQYDRCREQERNKIKSGNKSESKSSNRRQSRRERRRERSERNQDQE